MMKRRIAALALTLALAAVAHAQSSVPSRAADAGDGEAGEKSVASAPDDGRYVYNPRDGLTSRAGASAIDTQKTFQATIGSQIYSTIGTPMGSAIGRPR